jgi:hypothetical protein
MNPVTWLNSEIFTTASLNIFFEMEDSAPASASIDAYGVYLIIFSIVLQ